MERGPHGGSDGELRGRPAWGATEARAGWTRVRWAAAGRTGIDARNGTEVVLLDALSGRSRVFHLLGHGEWSNELDRFVRYTECGRSVGVYAAHLRVEDAARFARLCERCP